MKKIAVETLKPGMAYDKAVYLDPDNMLVQANESITASDIERLKKWNIEEVETSGEEIEIKDDPASDEITPLPGLKPQNLEEKKDISSVLDDLKNTFKFKDEFVTLLKEGDELLSLAYPAIANERPFQVSRIRGLAESISRLLDHCPECYIFTYFDDTPTSLHRHIMVSALYGGLMGNAIGLSQPKVIELIFSIMLMKIGMEKLPEEIRKKTGQFTDAEKQTMRTHPVLGYQLLTQVAKIKNSIAIVTLQHPEHFDGTGYPRQIKGNEMAENTKIAAIADSYAALLENKSYRKSKLPYEAMKELVTLGVYRYDPIFLKKLLDRLSIYPIGSIVKISDSSIGMVAGSVAGKAMRPIIMLLRDPEGQKITTPKFIHLLYQNNKYILQAISPDDVGIVFPEEIEAVVQNTQ